VRKGKAHTRRLQGTGTKSIIETHFAQFIAVCSGGKSVVSIFQISFKSS
jgi:hypothetical protein